MGSHDKKPGSLWSWIWTLPWGMHKFRVCVGVSHNLCSYCYINMRQVYLKNKVWKTVRSLFCFLWFFLNPCHEVRDLGEDGNKILGQHNLMSHFICSFWSALPWLSSPGRRRWTHDLASRWLTVWKYKFILITIHDAITVNTTVNDLLVKGVGWTNALMAWWPVPVMVWSEMFITCEKRIDVVATQKRIVVVSPDDLTLCATQKFTF